MKILAVLLVCFPTLANTASESKSMPVHLALAAQIEFLLQNAKTYREFALMAPVDGAAQERMLAFFAGKKALNEPVPKISASTLGEKISIAFTGSKNKLDIDPYAFEFRLNNKKLKIPKGATLNSVLSEVESILPGNTASLIRYFIIEEAHGNMGIGLALTVLIFVAQNQFFCDPKVDRICLFGRTPFKAEEEAVTPELKARSLAEMYYRLNRPTLFTCSNDRLYRQTGDLKSVAALRALLEESQEELKDANITKEAREKFRQRAKSLPPQNSVSVVYSGDRLTEIESSSPKCDFEVDGYKFKAKPPATAECLEIQERSLKEIAPEKNADAMVLSALGINLNLANACCVSACKDYLKQMMVSGGSAAGLGGGGGGGNTPPNR